MQSPALGLEPKTVRLVPYDPRWPVLFKQEAARLRGALAGPVIAIEHVGSTAVPGLIAKPILDVMAAVADLAQAVLLVETLAVLGYRYRPDDVLPGRLFFVQSSRELRTHNLHLCEFGASFWRDHLRFRDRLRADSALAAAYARLKRELALRHPNDRIAYTDGKDAFVAAALVAATA